MARSGSPPFQNTAQRSDDSKRIGATLRSTWTDRGRWAVGQLLL